jgi:hypothetical protein
MTSRPIDRDTEAIVFGQVRGRARLRNVSTSPPARSAGSLGAPPSRDENQ